MIEGNSVIEEEVKRLNGDAELSPMPATGAASNIDIIDGGLSIGQFQSPDGQWTPALIVNVAFAVRLGNENALKLSEALAESAGKKVIIRPHMTVVKGA